MMRMRKWLGFGEIDNAKREMYAAVTKASAASGLVSLEAAKNCEVACELKEMLAQRQIPLFIKA